MYERSDESLAAPFRASQEDSAALLRPTMKRRAIFFHRLMKKYG
jgi:hypothetical protein